MIASLWANSNYDDDKGTRQNAIREIEESFRAATDQITGNAVDDERIDRNNPFFGQMKDGIATIQAPRDDEGTVAQAIQPDAPDNNEFSRYIDQ